MRSVHLVAVAAHTPALSEKTSSASELTVMVAALDTEDRQAVRPPKNATRSRRTRMRAAKAQGRKLSC
jgi:hypothetical protein